MATASFGFSQITSGDWTYVLNEVNEATITDYGGRGGAVTIPSLIDGYFVVGVSVLPYERPIFGYGNTSVTSVTIPNSVPSIGDFLFNGCSSLASVTILASDQRRLWVAGLETKPRPPVMTSIGFAAFAGCTSLVSVIIPAGVISIGDDAFSGCSSLTSVTIPESVMSLGSECFAGAPLTTALIPSRFLASLGNIGLPPQLATNLLIEGLAVEGVATKDDLFGAITGATAQAIAEVQADPNSYNLYSSTQCQDILDQGIAQGQAEVTGNPSAYDLYSEASIMEMSVGAAMVKKTGTEADLEVTIETTEDLASGDWQVADRLTYAVPMDSAQEFLRITTGAPYVTPDVELLAHPQLGSILTDAVGRVLYFFVPDSVGSNPIYWGSTWPYVAVPPEPKADAGIEAVLASSSFGQAGKNYLTVNGRPVYIYAGDTAAGDAKGHGVGNVWFTIEASGTLVVPTTNEPVVE